MFEKANQLIIFHAICHNGSLSKAATSLNCSVSHISKQLAKLEESLDTQLIQRSSRQITVTDAGGQLLKRAEQLVNTIEIATSEFETMKDQVSGVVRIALAQSFGTMHIIPRINELKRSYPLLDIEVTLVDYQIDMLKDGIDLWITNIETIPEGYIAQRIADTRFVLAASPEYLIANALPTIPSDLNEHNCITYQSRNRKYNHWSFKRGNEQITLPVSGNYRVDLAEAVRDAVIDGWGVGYLATYLLKDEFREGKLIQLLPDWSLTQSMPIYAVYPKRKHLPKKTLTIINYIKDSLGIPPYWDRNLNAQLSRKLPQSKQI